MSAVIGDWRLVAGRISGMVDQCTYAFMGITLDDGKSAGVLGVLHDKPMHYD